MLLHQVSYRDSSRPRNPRIAVYKDLIILFLESQFYEVHARVELLLQVAGDCVQHLHHFVVEEGGELWGVALGDSQDMRYTQFLEGFFGGGDHYVPEEEVF